MLNDRVEGLIGEWQLLGVYPAQNPDPVIGAFFSAAVARQG
jgi:hypothetical protein